MKAMMLKAAMKPSRWLLWQEENSSTKPREFQVFLLSYLVEDCNDEVLEVLDVAKSPQEDVETPFPSPMLMVTVQNLLKRRNLFQSPTVTW